MKGELCMVIYQFNQNLKHPSSPYCMCAMHSHGMDMKRVRFSSQGGVIYDC